MKINKWHLSRLAWVIRKRLTDEDLQAAPIEVLAEELASGAAVYIRSEILGERKSTTVEIDVPDGPWQSLKACFGLQHRMRTVSFSAFHLFPDLVPPTDHNTVVYMELENANGNITSSGLPDDAERN